MFFNPDKLNGKSYYEKVLYEVYFINMQTRCHMEYFSRFRVGEKK